MRINPPPFIAVLNHSRLARLRASRADIGSLRAERPKGPDRTNKSSIRNERSMNLTVIGLGYVGTVAAAGLASAGHDVLGIDIDRERVGLLSSGTVPIYEPGLGERVTSGLANGRLQFLHRDDATGPVGDAVLVATGTPPTEAGAADLRQVRSALEWINSRQSDGLLVVMKSTVASRDRPADHRSRPRRVRTQLRSQSGVPSRGSRGRGLGLA